MSTQRYISTSFWDDEWIQSLDPSEKLLYLYFMTNPLTNIAGVYKLSVRRICFDTGFTADTIGHVMQKFEIAKKAYRIGEYIALPAWPKHQKWETKKSIKEGIDAVIAELPSDVLIRLKEISYLYPMGDHPPTNPPPTPHRPTYSDSDSDSDSHSDIDAKGQEASVLESIKYPNDFPRQIYDKWQAIPGVTKDCDYMYWIQREFKDIHRAIQGFHSDIVLKSLDNYRKERENPKTWMTAKVSSRQFFTGGLFETCRGATDAKPKDVPRCKNQDCGWELAKNGPYAGQCINDECDMYHRRQE